ncbi:MAG: IclR family transcriptional regulator [Gammaproteobacteria bacterium]
MPKVDRENCLNNRGSALEKAIKVLNVLTTSDRPLALIEIAERLNLPRQTIHRVVQSLAQNQLALRAPHKDRYQVGPAMIRLSIEALTTLNSTAPIRNVLRELVDQTGETCNIGILDQAEVVYIERIEGSSPLRLQLDIGSRVPFYCTAIGKLLAASQHKNVRSRLLNTVELKQHTAYTLIEPDALEQEFKKIRSQGYSFNNQEFFEGLTAVAVPIVNSQNLPVAGLAVHAPALRMDRQQALSLLPSMKEKAERIARSWGTGK